MSWAALAQAPAQWLAALTLADPWLLALALGTLLALLSVLALRLVLLLPCPLLNVLLGASSLPLRHFLWPSWLGLTLASLPWVWAGQGLAPLLRQQAPHLPTLAAALAALCTALLAAAWLRRRWLAGQQVGRAR